MQKLPIGIQTFSQIIKDNYIYVDKTKYALDIIQNYKYVFYPVQEDLEKVYF